MCFFLIVAVPQNLVVANAQYQVQIRSGDASWIYRPYFVNCSGMRFSFFFKKNLFSLVVFPITNAMQKKTTIFYL